jgi:hypothetical protein
MIALPVARPRPRSACHCGCLVSEAHVFGPRFGDRRAEGRPEVKEDIVFVSFWRGPFWDLGVEVGGFIEVVTRTARIISKILNVKGKRKSSPPVS